MIRVYCRRGESIKLFRDLEYKSEMRTSAMARLLGVNKRTYSDWRSGKYGFPLHSTEKVFAKYKLFIPKICVIRDDVSLKSQNGKKGGIVRNQKHGNPGTENGRVKGGLSSISTHKKINTGFKTAKNVTDPGTSEKLAEFCGAMIGDGGMSTYQVRITLNRIDDEDYSIYLKSIAEELFLLNSTMSLRKNIREIVLSSIKVVRLLHRYGLPIGDKIAQNIGIPQWIKEKDKYLICCLRGLFDTDGSVYLDSHVYKKNTYHSVNIAYTTYAKQLQCDIYDSLCNLGFEPLRSTKNRVALRKFEHVNEFFRIIQPSNHKHLKRYVMFMEE